MATSLFSPSWYRVQQLKPRLRKHVEIHRHDYRDRVWFVLQDHAAGRAHRLSPAAYRMVGLMDGKRTLQQLWDLANEQLAGRAPTQDETIRLLGQLHAADALICDVPPDSRELFRRYQRSERMKLKQKIWSPLAVRVPLWDPDAFLTATLPFVRPFFSRAFALIWLLVVIAGIALAASNFGSITENVIDRVLKPENLLVLWLIYPVVKAFHEFGHGYAVKINGGEVHEIGIMFLVLFPVPYVDASAASGFRDKHQRMLVGGIGIMVEMLLAAIALMVWLNAEPGAVHAVAYNVMLIGGVSTLLFNGNPLLRFDGYYVLADFLEIPNLGTRANKHLGYVMQKYLFGMREAESVTSMPAERFWFVVYGIAALIYRMFIILVIIAYIAGRFFIIGVLMAIWAFATQLAVPIAGGIGFLISSPRLKSNRPRAVATSLGIFGALLVLLFVIPAPHWTVADGVTWPSDNSQLRVGTNGFVTEIAATTGDNVSIGDPVVVADDPILRARLDVMKAQLKGLEIQRDALDLGDRVQAALVRAEIVAARSDMNRVEEQIAELVVRSPREGVAVVLRDADLLGRYVQKGDLVGYVIDAADILSVRVVIDQNDVDLVRRDTRSIKVMPFDWEGRSFTGEIIRETPGGINRLPTAALGLAGGGEVAIDPTDPSGIQTLKRVFEFEIRMPDEAAAPFLGRRIKVRFDHGYEPIGFQAYRSLRQLFLRLYNV